MGHWVVSTRLSGLVWPMVGLFVLLFVTALQFLHHTNDCFEARFVSNGQAPSPNRKRLKLSVPNRASQVVALVKEKVQIRHVRR